MTTKFATDRWHDHRSNTAQYLRNRFGVPRAWFRRSCSAANAASMTPNPYLEERFVCAAIVYPRAAHAAVARALAAAPWAFVVYWPVMNQRELITVVGVSTADPEAFVLEHAQEAMAWQVVGDGELYQYEPRPVVDYRIEAERDYSRRGPRGVDHASVHTDLISGQFTIEEICRRYSITRQTISNIRRKFGTFTPLKKRKSPTRKSQNDTLGVAGDFTNCQSVSS
jgi:hypothetical protein